MLVKKKNKTKSCSVTFCYSCKPCDAPVFLCLSLSLSHRKQASYFFRFVFLFRTELGVNFVPSGCPLTPINFFFYKERKIPDNYILCAGVNTAYDTLNTDSNTVK